MSTHTARPSIPQNRRAIAETATRDAIDRYEDARRLWVERHDAIHDDSDMDKWLVALDAGLEDARRQLVRTILAWEERADHGDIRDAEKRLARARGIIHRGRFYAAVPMPDHANGFVGETEGYEDLRDVMTLAVVAADDTVNLDVPPSDEPGLYTTRSAVPPAPEPRPEATKQGVVDMADVGDVEEDDQADDDQAEPQPRRRPAGKDESRPMPLLRQTMTICGPWDPMPATVEIIALADGVHLDDVTAGEGDVPELRHAGWHCLSGTPISLYARFIV